MSAERDVYELRPEPKFDRAQESAAGSISRMRAILAADVTPVMMPDELEILALQFQLAAVNLRTAARALRECEEERRRLAAWREREERRYEWVREDEDEVDGGRWTVGGAELLTDHCSLPTCLNSEGRAA